MTDTIIAGAQPVKKDEPGVNAVAAPQQTDYAEVIKQKDAEIARIREEKDNYRKGLLKAKGKDDNGNFEEGDETEEEKIRRIAKEEVLSTQESRIIREKEEAYNAVLKRNQELELALKNRSSVLNSASGANQDKPEAAKVRYFSDAQINALKARGFTDAMIEQAEKNSKSLQGGLPIVPVK